MDIKAIEDNIEELENDDTSVENVRELASLYIVRNNLRKSLESPGNEVITEYNDILPQYHKYIEIKKEYQLGDTSEKIVERAVKKVCKEIQDFIYTMYISTDMPKERTYIKEMLETLQSML